MRRTGGRIVLCLRSCRRFVTYSNPIPSLVSFRLLCICGWLTHTQAVPESVERILPNAIHNTGDSSSSAEKMAKKAGIGETHAAKGGEDSIVPKPVQKAVPKSVERALPNKIHNTKD